jgi:hypothetical protein
MTQAAQKFNAAAAAFTITLASLASSATAGRESTAVDLSALSPAIPEDVQIHGQITVGTTPTANTTIDIYAIGCWDGTNFDAGATGSDAALTPTGGDTRMELIEKIPVPVNTSNVPYTFKLGSLRALFGSLPRKVSIFVRNTTGVNLHATAGNHFVKYTPISDEGV